MDDNEYIFLTYKQKLTFLEEELKKVLHEIKISKLIYSLHGCDSYEELFRDNIPLLNDKKEGIIIAIKNLNSGDF